MTFEELAFGGAERGQKLHFQTLRRFRWHRNRGLPQVPGHGVGLDRENTIQQQRANQLEIVAPGLPLQPNQLGAADACAELPQGEWTESGIQRS
jgi:hypothetical protein